MIAQFFKRFFQKKSSTSGSDDSGLNPISISVPEKLNLDTFKLGHSRVGDPVCGHDSYFSPKGELWIKNHEQGIEVGIKNGRLEFIYLNIANYQQPLTLQNKEISLVGLDIDGWKALFGEPYWYDPDGNEELIFHEPDPEKIELQAEFEHGQLSHLLITSEPLMADEEQRYAYGVTKLWPPQ